MSVTYQIDDDHRLRLWYLGGEVDPREVLRRISLAGLDPNFRPEYDVLVIFEENAQLHGLNVETLAEIRITAIESRNTRPVNRTGKAAMICPNQMALIMGRLYQAAGMADPDYFLDYRICTNVAEAGSWLSRDLRGLKLPQYAQTGN